jgi:hypothetical protein
VHTFRPRTSTVPTRNPLVAVSRWSTECANPTDHHARHVLPGERARAQMPLGHEPMETDQDQPCVEIRIGVRWPFAAIDSSADEQDQLALGRPGGQFSPAGLSRTAKRLRNHPRQPERGPKGRLL